MAEGISLDQFMTLPAKSAPAKGISVDDFMKLPAAQPKKEERQPSRGFLGEVTNNFFRTLIRENPKLAGNALEGLAEVLEPDLAFREEYHAALQKKLGGPLPPMPAPEPSSMPSKVREIAATLQEFGKQGEKETQPAVGEFLKIRTDSLGNMGEDALAWLGQAIGQAGGSSAPSIVAGMGTAAVTKNPIVGFIAGAFGPSYIQNYGDTYGAMRDNKDIQAAITSGKITKKQVAELAAAWAVPMAALDTVQAERIFGAAAKELKGNLIQRMVKRALIGGATEAPTEGLQQVLQEAAIEAGGGDRTLTEQATAVFENFAAGGVGGAPIAALRPGAQAKEAPPPAADTGAVVPPGAQPADTVLPAEEPPGGALPAAPAQPQMMVVNDPAFIDADGNEQPAGPLHGMTVAVLKPGTNETTVRLSDGRITRIGSRLLEPSQEVAKEVIQQAVEEPPPEEPPVERLTPADVKSPIPNEVIDAGKALVEEATGKPSTFTTTTVINGHREVVTGNVADLVAQDRAETNALIERITAGVSQPEEIAAQWQQAAPPAGAAEVAATPTPAEAPASVAAPVADLSVAREYPTAPRDEWYSDADYQARGGEITMMTPDEFLARAKPLDIDETSRDNIDDLKRHIESGRTLDPLKLYGDGGEDGRHRAIAAKELGIASVPVIEFSTPKAQTPPSTTQADVSDDAHPRSEDTSSFEEFVAKSKAHIAAREAKAKEMADRGGSTRMEHKTREGQKALVGPDMAEPGKFRVTRFDKQGPFGHTTFNTLEEAANEALRDGYVEVARPEVLSEPAKQTALKDKIAANRGAAAPAQAPKIASRPIKDDVAITPTGRDVPVTYAVVEADDLIASQRDEGGANPAYPQELQPRDRSRGSSDVQINQIAQNLDPRLLDQNPNASDGAPIISEDGVVESGNGRVLAVRRAYSQGMPTGEAYRQYLADQGYPVEGMNRPVLVRVRQGQISPDERAAFTRESNERTTLKMSEPEQAMADAAALQPNVLALFRGGDVAEMGNRDFVRRFMGTVVNPNEREVTANNEVSQPMVRRIQAALLAKAYGNADLVTALFENKDTNISAIGGALRDVAGQWAQMRMDAADGTINPDVDVTDYLLQAVQLIQRARSDGRPVAEYVAQTDVFSGTTIVPEAEMLMRLMFRNNVSWTQPVGREKLADALSYYVTEARKTSAGVDLLGETAPPAHKILAQAKARQYGAEETQAKLALGNRTAGPNDGASAGERAVEAKPGSKPEARPAVSGKDEGKAPSKLAKTVAAVRAKLKGKRKGKRAAKAKAPPPPFPADYNHKGSFGNFAYGYTPKPGGYNIWQVRDKRTGEVVRTQKLESLNAAAKAAEQAQLEATHDLVGAAWVPKALPPGPKLSIEERTAPEPAAQAALKERIKARRAGEEVKPHKFSKDDISKFYKAFGEKEEESVIPPSIRRLLAKIFRSKTPAEAAEDRELRALFTEAKTKGITRAMEIAASLKPTLESWDDVRIRSAEWMNTRLYDIGKGFKANWDQTVDYLVDVAEKLATTEINQGRAEAGLEPLPDYDVVNGHEVVLIMGPPGAGKSSIANPIAYRLRAAISDIDEAKKVIPGYTVPDPDNPGKMLKGIGAGAVQVESSVLGAHVTEELLNRGANLVIPTVGDSPLRIEELRTTLVNKGYKVHLVLMKVPPLHATIRMLGRFAKTGRLITPSYFKDVVWKPPHTFEYAQTLGRFDGYATVSSTNTSDTTVVGVDGGVQFLALGEIINRDGTFGSPREGAAAGTVDNRLSRKGGERKAGGKAKLDTAPARRPTRGVIRTSQGDFIYTLNPEFEAKAEAMLAELRPILERLAPGTGFNVWQSITRIFNDKVTNIQGTYARGVIELALSAKSPELTLHHEAVHALWDVFTDTEKAILTRRSEKEWITDQIKRDYPEERWVEEGIAHAISDWHHGESRRVEDGVIAKAFRKFMALARTLGSWFTNNSIRTAEDVFADVASGKIGKRLAKAQTYRRLHPIMEHVEAVPPANPLPADAMARLAEADQALDPAVDAAIVQFTKWTKDGERVDGGIMDQAVRDGQGDLERAARGDDLALAVQIERAFAPVRDFLRAKFGDTVKLYRRQRQVAAGKKRSILSWTFNPEYAWKGHEPAHKLGVKQESVVHAADVPLEHIVWATNRGGEEEFILHNDPNNQVSIDSTGALVIRPAAPKPTTETVQMFEGPREQFVIPGAEKISQKSLFERQMAGKMQAKRGQKSVGDLPLFSDQKDQLMLFEVEPSSTPPNESAPRFKLNAAPHGTQQAQQVQQGFLARGQWIDRAVRIPFDLLGGRDEKGFWRPSKRLGDRLGITPQRREGAAVGSIFGALVGGVVAGPAGITPGIIAGGTVGTFLLGSAAWPTSGPFSWFRGFAENAKRGLISNYGLDPEYVEAYRKSGLGAAEIARKAEGIMQVLQNAGVGTTEAKVLQAILSGEAVNDADMTRLSVPIREAIDALGAEMVQEGLISAESFERNRGAYLHRVYLKHEADVDNLSGWVAKKMANRRKKIIGDELKGRGIFMDVENARLMRDVESFKTAARGGPVKGEKFKVIDEISTAADLLSGKPKEKVLRRVYWPASEPVPAKYQGPSWVQRGTSWEARQVANGKTVLWRDYSKEERGQMGEIVDARYTIAKTFMLAANDISTGKFFREVAHNEEWARSQQPPDGTWKEGGEYNLKNGRYWEDPNIQWVKVPDGNIPKTQVKRWGALAGKFVRAEIWRDLNEINLQHTASTWRVLNAQWKKNKTSRNPVVHTNNIMSNLIWMDIADVRAQDLYRGIKAYFTGNADYIEARDSGAFGSDMVAQDLRQNVLKPILDEISKQSTKKTANPILDWTGIPFLQRARLVGVIADKLWTWAKKADNGLLRAYQAEDEIFRMAAYLRRRSQGEDTNTAAKNSRDQFLDYDIRAPWVVAAKNSVLPFISYTYRAVPKLMENVQNRPWKLLKYATLAWVANELAYMLDEGDDDDDEKRGRLINREEIERAGLRDEEQGMTWLRSPRMIRMPYRDANGLPVFLDVRRWIPAGDVFDMEQGNAALPIPAPLLFGGPLQIAMELRMNRSAFTGEDITNSLTQTPTEKLGAAADYAWKAWAPNSFWSPNSWYWTKISRAIYGVRDQAGNINSVPQAFLSSIGIKVKSVDVENGVMWHFKDMKLVETALRSEMYSISSKLDRGILDQDGFNREAAKIMAKFENLGVKANELNERITPRREPVQ